MVKAKLVAELRSMTGAGIVDCKNSLEETGGDLKKAGELLRKKGIVKAAKRSNRATSEGLVYSYVHNTGKMGALVEVSCETDFVARNEEFKALCHNIAMQIVAMNPLYLSRDSIPQEVIEKEKEIFSEEMRNSGKPSDVIEKIIEGKLGKWYKEVSLLDQPFVKDEDKTVKDLVTDSVSKMGENIQIKRFARFAMDGDTPQVC